MPLITLLTDMVARCRLLAAHGLRSCLSVRTQPLTATGAPSQTSTISYHTIPYHTIPYHTIPYHTIPYSTIGPSRSRARPLVHLHRPLPYHTIPYSVLTTVFSHGPMRNIGFLGRWGTYACPQCLPSDIVPIRSWTRTLRPPGIRHRHLPCHTIHTLPYHTITLYLTTQFTGAHTWAG